MLKRITNGRTQWKNSSGKALKQIQAEQAGVPDDES